MCDPINCNRIESLTNCWKVYQSAEKQSKCPDNICRSSFTGDGIICEENYKKAKTKVLFIAKESNLSSTADNGQICGDGKTFWLQNVLYDPTINRGRAGSRFINGLSVLYNAIKAYQPDHPAAVCKDNTSLKEVAYINLNKRGGVNKCDNDYLESYVCFYQCFIRKQIDLINPDLIVCCGDDVKALAITYKLLGNRKYVTVFHPSYFKVSYETNIRRLECDLKSKGYK